MVDSLSERIGALYGEFSSWRRVGEELAKKAVARGLISSIDGHAAPYGALANAVYHGTAKDSPKLRRVLGLPPAAVPVQPCTECGHIHEQKATCPHKLKRARRRPRRWRLHYEAGHGDAGRERADELRAGMQAADCESFTEYVDMLRHRVNE